MTYFFLFPPILCCPVSLCTAYTLSIDFLFGARAKRISTLDSDLGHKQLNLERIHSASARNGSWRMNPTHPTSGEKETGARRRSSSTRIRHRDGGVSCRSDSRKWYCCLATTHVSLGDKDYIISQNDIDAVQRILFHPLASIVDINYLLAVFEAIEFKHLGWFLRKKSNEKS